MSVRTLAACAALALAAAFAMPAAAAVGDKAGVTASVRGQVQQVSYRTPQAAIGRNVGSGDQVFLGDRIVTRAASGVQIMLLDGTTFSIGPDASMVIDEFVYDPATSSGRLTAKLTRGTLRVISGRLARQDGEAIRMRLPQATVGIRGTMAILAGDPNGSFVGLFGVGPNNQSGGPASYLSINIGGTEFRIYRTGYGCTVSAATPVCNPAPVDPQFLVQLLGLISGNLRQIDLVQFEELTGLDLFQALQLMQAGNFEGLFQRFDQLFQDQTRPGAAPPPAPDCGSCCFITSGQSLQWADTAGRPPGIRARPGKRKPNQRKHYKGRQVAC